MSNDTKREGLVINSDSEISDAIRKQITRSVSLTAEFGMALSQSLIEKPKDDDVRDLTFVYEIDGDKVQELAASLATLCAVADAILRMNSAKKSDETVPTGTKIH